MFFQFILLDSFVDFLLIWKQKLLWQLHVLLDIAVLYIVYTTCVGFLIVGSGLHVILLWFEIIQHPFQLANKYSHLITGTIHIVQHTQPQISRTRSHKMFLSTDETAISGICIYPQMYMLLLGQSPSKMRRLPLRACLHAELCGTPVQLVFQ